MISKILEVHGFELVDTILETYSLDIEEYTVRFQANPIYCNYKCTISSKVDTSYCIEWKDELAVKVIENFINVMFNIPSFDSGKEVDEFVEKYHGLIFDKVI